MWVVGNWKMYGSGADLHAEMAELGSHLYRVAHAASQYVSARPAGADAAVRVVICPPAVLAAWIQAKEWLPSLPSDAPINIHIGAQDLSRYLAEGAYTGELSGSLLAGCGFAYALIGHSERRQLLGENETVVGEKLAAAWSAGLCPIVCVGEPETVMAAGETAAWLHKQIATVLAVWERQPSHTRHTLPLIMAYEPLWAIGTGRVPRAEAIQWAHACIQQQLADRDPALAGTPVLYGGSVKPNNTQSLLEIPGVSGVLVGGASRNMGDFAAIVQAACGSVAR